MLQLSLCSFSLFVQVFFSPEIYSSELTSSLPEVIDKCIQSAPIDTRRALYKVNILVIDKKAFVFLNATEQPKIAKIDYNS